MNNWTDFWNSCLKTLKVQNKFGFASLEGKKLHFDKCNFLFLDLLSRLPLLSRSEVVHFFTKCVILITTARWKNNGMPLYSVSHQVFGLSNLHLLCNLSYHEHYHLETLFATPKIHLSTQLEANYKMEYICAVFCCPWLARNISYNAKRCCNWHMHIVLITFSRKC